MSRVGPNCYFTYFICTLDLNSKSVSVGIFSFEKNMVAIVLLQEISI